MFVLLDVIWVCGDVSEVAMVVDNPLPAEIKVNNMVYNISSDFLTKLYLYRCRQNQIF